MATRLLPPCWKLLCTLNGKEEGVWVFLLLFFFLPICLLLFGASHFSFSSYFRVFWYNSTQASLCPETECGMRSSVWAEGSLMLTVPSSVECTVAQDALCWGSMSWTHTYSEGIFDSRTSLGHFMHSLAGPCIVLNDLFISFGVIGPQQKINFRCLVLKKTTVSAIEMESMMFQMKFLQH